MLRIREAQELFTKGTQLLNNEPDEQRELFYRCIDHLTQQERIVWKLNNEPCIEQKALENLIQQLNQQIPIQYCVGYEWFGNLKLKVNSHVLIPRPETYELVLWVADCIRKKGNIKQVIDLGTGSGCIPIWLKHSFPQLHVTAIDISKDALQVAQENAQFHECNIQFLLDDMEHPNHEFLEKFDIIISNPPYITHAEKEDMQPQVLFHEPNEALFVHHDDALQFYKAIVQFSLKNLNPDGEIFVEINRAYGQEILQLFEQHGFTAVLKYDMYNNPRMINASRNS